MIRIDEPTLPVTSPGELRAEVQRRAGRFRHRRRLVGGAALSGTVLAVVVALVAVASGPGESRRTTRVGADRTTVPDTVPDDTAPPAPQADGAGPSSGPGARPGRPAARPGAASPAPRPGASAPSSAPPATSKPAERGPSGGPTAEAKVSLLLSRWDGVHVIGPDGSDRKVRVPTTWDARWSPDGRHLLMPRDYRLDVSDLQTEAWRTVFPGHADDRALAGAAWMPDSRTVVFTRAVPKDLVYDRYAMWTVDIETGALRHLRDAVEGDGSHFSVTADGRILYGCQRPGGRVCVTDGAGADLGVVPNSPPMSGFEVSPDGQWLAYVSNFNDVYSIALVRTDGSQQRRIGHRVDFSRRPAWYGDSSRVVFGLQLAHKEPQPCTSTPPCPNDGGVWSMRLDGTDPRHHPGTADKDQLVGAVAA